MSEAPNILLRRAPFDSLDEGTQAMLVPDISRAVREAARREIQENMSRLLGVQTDRLFGVLVTCSTRTPEASSGRTTGSRTPGSHPAGGTLGRGSGRPLRNAANPRGAVPPCMFVAVGVTHAGRGRPSPPWSLETVRESWPPRPSSRRARTVEGASSPHLQGWADREEQSEGRSRWRS